MKPDDITDEEIDAYGQEHTQPIDALAAMNALRDRRVRAEVIEEIAREIEAHASALGDTLDAARVDSSYEWGKVNALTTIAERVRAMTTKGDTDA